MQKVNEIEYTNSLYNYKSKIRLTINIDELCFFLVVLDIMFLPYLSFTAISASVVVIALWTMARLNTLSRDKEFVQFIIMLILMLISTLVSAFYVGNLRFETSFETSIKRLFQYGLCLCYYFFFKYYFGKKYINLNKIVLALVVYIALFAVLFQLFPHEYAVAKFAVNPADNHTYRYLANLVDYRFNYLWTDPNNISYMVDGLSAWYLLQKGPSLKQKLLCLLISTYITFCTVSNGGLITLVMILLAIVLMQIAIDLKKGKVPIKSVVFIFVLGVIFTFLILRTSLISTIYENYITKYLDRLAFYSGRQSVSGGRLEDIKSAFKLMSPLFAFIGCGKEGISHEIGHIYWICMYGFPAYLIFMWLLFRKVRGQSWSQYIWIIPFFVGFTLNVAIGEFKWMAIYLLLLAYSRTSNEESLDVMVKNKLA